MPPLPRALTRLWTSVELFIGYHRDRNGTPHTRPRIWSPRNGQAAIHADPDVQETYLTVRAADRRATGDVHIRLLPDRLTASRDHGLGWDSLVLTDNGVSVRVGAVRITVRQDGSVSHVSDAGVTHVEADGAVLRQTECVEAMISGDGNEVVSRTAERLAAIRGEAVICKPR